MFLSVLPTHCHLHLPTQTQQEEGEGRLGSLFVFIGSCKNCFVCIYN